VRNTEVMFKFNVGLLNQHLCNKVLLNKMKLVHQDMYILFVHVTHRDFEYMQEEGRLF
jgi:hypothetical protein